MSNSLLSLPLWKAPSESSVGLSCIDLYKIINSQMKDSSIELQFSRANRRLLVSLSPQQRSEAIQSFRILYEEEMRRINSKLTRQQQVQRNQQLKQQQEKTRSEHIHNDLKQRMQLHFKKRELLHLQKLKQCKQIDGLWRDRIKTIASQAKNKLKQNALMSNRLGQEALKFWQERQEKQERSRVNLEKKSQAKPRYFSQDNTADLVERNTHFLTEANVDTDHYGSRVRHQAQPYLPSVRRGSAVRQEERGSKSVAIQRPKSQIIREHLMKSSELWQERDGTNFQKAMQKLQQIEQTRNKARQKLAHQSQRLRRSRMMKEGSHEQRFFKIKTQERHISPRGTHHYSTHQREATTPISPQVQLQPSRIHPRKNQLLQLQFNLRSRHFQLELRKEQKNGLRKMVKQAVQAAKVQALR